MQMRMIPFPFKDMMTDEEADKFFNKGDVIVAETNQTQDALESINRVLQKSFGLEIVQYDAGSSDLVVEVRKIGE